jgi:hypothetical protein
MAEHRFEFEEMQHSQFREVDLSGARMHGMNLSNLKVTDAFIVNVELSGIVGNLKVNDVDVTAYVESELNRRHPERTRLAPIDPAGMRDAWTMVGELWDKTMARARALPEVKLNESVDGEYSFLETLRHLVFAVDRWITGPVLGEASPFHPLGMPPFCRPEEARALGLEIDAKPSLAEVVAVREDRRAKVASVIADLTVEELVRQCPDPHVGSPTVQTCLHVVLREEWAHNRYATRDLDALAG